MRARKHLGTAVVGLALSALLTAGCGTVPGQAGADPAASTTTPPSLPSPAEPTFEPPSPTPSAPTSTSAEPSTQRSATPAESPSTEPSAKPSQQPSTQPSKQPTEQPTEQPSKKPTAKPDKPADKPTKKASGSRTVYLTFDDGPSAFTGQVLDILARYEAKATFFVIGDNVSGGASLVRRAANAGHSIQNHTWNHPDLRSLSSAQIRSQIQRTDDAIRDASGGRSTCVRPPYGATNAKVRAVLADLGKRQLLWDIDTLDWQRPGADRIYGRVVGDARSGSVVLAHDGGGTRTQTVAALPRILRTLKAEGYRFGALCR